MKCRCQEGTAPHGDGFWRVSSRRWQRHHDFDIVCQRADPRRLDEIEVVERLPDDTNRIFFGATIDLEREDGEALRYRIVGADEFDQDPHYISVDSPLAQRLLGKRKGDLISLSLESQTTRYTVVAIHYPPVEDRRKKSSNAYKG